MLVSIKTNGNKTIPALTLSKNQIRKTKRISEYLQTLWLFQLWQYIKYFDPITLPSATSACLRTAAINVVQVQAEVPTATSVNPTTSSDIP